MTSHVSSEGASPVFPHTHWSVVLAATREPSRESAAALDTICRDYWHPLYSYARRCGQSPHDAQDLIQEFFHRLLEKRWLDAASPEKGRLRSFLIVALKHFMSNEWRRASAQRRGGGQSAVQFDTAFAESRYAIDPKVLAPDQTFDRQWALNLLELTLNRLRTEFTAAGKTADFEALKSCLIIERAVINYQLIAAKLDVTEGAVRVSVHRLRKRFREVYREEILHTLGHGENLEEELHHLALALAPE